MEDDVHTIEISEDTQGGDSWVMQGPCKYTKARGFEQYRRSYDIQHATMYLPPHQEGNPDIAVDIPLNKITLIVPYSGVIRFSYECKFPSTPELSQFLHEDIETPCIFRWWGSYNRLNGDVLRFIDDHTLELLAPMRSSTIFVKQDELPEYTLSPWYISNPDTFTLWEGSIMVRVHFRFHTRCLQQLMEILG
jgi:hypothetical protein